MRMRLEVLDSRRRVQEETIKRLWETLGGSLPSRSCPHTCRMTYEQNTIAMEEGKDDTDIPLKSSTGVRRQSAVHTTKHMVS